MGVAARKYMEDRSFEQAFLKLWDLYQLPIETASTEPYLLHYLLQRCQHPHLTGLKRKC